MTGSFTRNILNKDIAKTSRITFKQEPQASIITTNFRSSIAQEYSSDDEAAEKLTESVSQQNVLLNSQLIKLVPQKKQKKIVFLENKSQQAINKINAAMSNLLVSEKEKFKFIALEKHKNEKIKQFELYQDTPAYFKLNLTK